MGEDEDGAFVLREDVLAVATEAKALKGHAQGRRELNLRDGWCGERGRGSLVGNDALLPLGEFGAGRGGGTTAARREGGDEIENCAETFGVSAGDAEEVGEFVADLAVGVERTVPEL